MLVRRLCRTLLPLPWDRAWCRAEYPRVAHLARQVGPELGDLVRIGRRHEFFGDLRGRGAR
jgi:hypothetical protein